MARNNYFNPFPKRLIARRVHQWYGDRIPHINTPAFMRFATAFAGIVRAMNNSNNVNIFIDKVGNPYCQQTDTGFDLHFPSMLFTKQSYVDLPDYENFAGEYAIMASTFVAVHETLHSLMPATQLLKDFYVAFVAECNKRYSLTLEDHVDLGKKFPRVFKFVNTTRQIWEDIYIHTHCNFKTLMDFIKYGPMVLSNRAILTVLIDLARSVEDYVFPLEHLTMFVMGLRDEGTHDFFKEFQLKDDIRGINVQTFIEHSSKIRKIKAKNHSEINDLCLDFIFTCLKDFDFESPECDNPQEQQEGEGGMGMGDAEKAFKEFIESLSEEELKEFEEMMENLIEVGQENIKEIYANPVAKDELDEPETKIQILSRALNDYIVTQNLSLKQPTTILKPDDSFLTLGKSLAEIKTWLQTQKQKGAKLTGTRLQRTQMKNLWTTGRIYKAPKDENDYVPDLRIVMLIDLSGSMGGNNLYKKCLEAAYGAAKSLEVAGIPFACFGHTTIIDEDEDTTYVPFLGSFEPGTSRWDKKFQGRYQWGLANACSVSRRNNYDSDVLQYLYNNAFPPLTKPERRVIIVFNDGAPCYTTQASQLGVDGTMMTKMVVEKIREDGTIVLGVALVSDVVDSNRAIYGENFTIDASENLVQSVQYVMRKIREGSL